MGKGILEQGAYTIAQPYDFQLSASNDSPTLFSSKALGVKDATLTVDDIKTLCGNTNTRVTVISDLDLIGSIPCLKRKGYDVLPTIKKVIYDIPNNATIVYFADGTKEIARVMNGDTFDKETGVMQCIVKKLYGCRSKWLKTIVDKGIEIKPKKK